MCRSFRRALLPTAALAAAGLLALPAAASATAGHGGHVGSPPGVSAHAAPARTLQRPLQPGVHRYIKNRKTGLCLASRKDIFGPNGSVFTLPCDPRDNSQSWMGAAEQIRNDQIGLCLENNAKGEVFTAPCSFGGRASAQNWHHDGPTFVNRYTGWCLDSNRAGNVYTLPCSPGHHNDYQNWDVPRFLS